MVFIKFGELKEKDLSIKTKGSHPNLGEFLCKGLKNSDFTIFNNNYFP